MCVAVAHLAAHARPLTALVAGDAFEAFSLQGLTHGLMLELIVLTVPFSADVALIHLASVAPHVTMTLRTPNTQCARFRSIAERTRAGVLLDTLSRVTDECLAEIANRPHKLESRDSGSRVLYKTVGTHAAAFHPSTVSTYRELLHLTLKA